MTARRSAFDAGCSFVHFRDCRDSRYQIALHEFFSRWQLHDVTEKGEEFRGDDYDLVVIFWKLPPSHSALKDWFMMGIQFAQWTPEVQEFPRHFDDDDPLSRLNFRRAVACNSFRTALEELAIDPSQIEDLYADFLRCRGPEVEAIIRTLRNRLRHIAQSLDDRSPLPELGERKEQSVTYYLGDTIVSGSKYINEGQAGTVGPHGTVVGNTFQQMWTRTKELIDLESLSTDLAALRKELRDNNQDLSHDIEIGAVAAAEKAASAGDGPGALNHLSSAGKWALDIATKVGTSVAAAALKTALGL